LQIWSVHFLWSRSSQSTLLLGHGRGGLCESCRAPLTNLIPKDHLSKLDASGEGIGEISPPIHTGQVKLPVWSV
jgi:hypothetical protein